MTLTDYAPRGPQEQDTGTAEWTGGPWPKGYIPEGAAPRYPKGVSGNPGGRVKGVPDLNRALQKYLRDHPEDVEDIIKGLVSRAKGDDRALKELWDRKEGPVVQKQQVETTETKLVRLEDEEEKADGQD